MESYKGKNKKLESPHLTPSKDNCWWGNYYTCVVVSKICEQIVDLNIGKIGHAIVFSKFVDCTHHIKNINVSQV